MKFKNVHSLGALLSSDQNSFNVVRLVAALSVLISHSCQLLAGVSAEPLSWTSYTLSQQAVNVFFILSGMLLSQSIALNPNWTRFLAARALRILPGLFVCGIVVGWIVGPLATSMSLSEFLTDAHTIFYPILSVIFFDKAELHDVFLRSTQPGVVNAPLWTIKYELLAYIAFSILMVAGMLRSRAVVLAGCVAFAMLLTVSEAFYPLPASSFLRFGFCFGLGVAAYHYRSALPLHAAYVAVLLALALITNGTFGAPVLSILFFGYLALYAGSVVVPRLTGFCHRIDLSYGIYLYAWPLQQLIIEWFGGTIPVWQHIALSILATIPLAFFSWFAVEKPSLGLKAKFGVATRGQE